MLKTAFFTFIAALIITMLATYIYLGAYKEAKFEYISFSQKHIYYKEVLGSYNQTSFVISEVEKTLKCKDSFAIFFDSPEKVQEQDLRSWVGCIYDTKLANAPETLKHKIIGPSKNILEASFAGSPALGPTKVYQVVSDRQMVPSLFPSLEIYHFDQDGHLNSRYYFALDITY